METRLWIFYARRSCRQIFCRFSFWSKAILTFESASLLPVGRSEILQAVICATPDNFGYLTLERLQHPPFLRDRIGPENQCPLSQLSSQLRNLR
jgi:hypothetical protein